MRKYDIEIKWKNGHSGQIYTNVGEPRFDKDVGLVCLPGVGKTSDTCFYFNVSEVLTMVVKYRGDS